MLDQPFGGVNVVEDTISIAPIRSSKYTDLKAAVCPLQNLLRVRSDVESRIQKLARWSLNLQEHIGLLSWIFVSDTVRQRFIEVKYEQFASLWLRPFDVNHAALDVLLIDLKRLQE